MIKFCLISEACVFIFLKEEEEDDITCHPASVSPPVTVILIPVQKGRHTRERETEREITETAETVRRERQ